MANKNRDKGHRWELAVRKTLLALFPNCLTSRNDSRTEDAKCIDFTNTGNLAVQCKTYASNPNFSVELDKIQSKKIKVLAYKYNRIIGKKGEFAVLRWADFVRILGDIGEVYENEEN
jgi:hypothetical protein